ncbi:hypothetical protein HU230_0036765 [Bradyrhizobium quebecense]|uniref:Uncharacterized protein n=1 Tax=Bradyrhizobium quebecense TaxID=2748629 RepID=A0A973WXH0_9BRAD|nr:hypothetical protein [Bradyrhizobium quebecense]UGA43742.1 hypothetical protein HU230_0036765 [Bradyrhizobium quebecense]
MSSPISTSFRRGQRSRLADRLLNEARVKFADTILSPEHACGAEMTTAILDMSNDAALMCGCAMRSHAIVDVDAATVEMQLHVRLVVDHLAVQMRMQRALRLALHARLDRRCSHVLRLAVGSRNVGHVGLTISGAVAHHVELSMLKDVTGWRAGSVGIGSHLLFSFPKW